MSKQSTEAQVKNSPASSAVELDELHKRTVGLAPEIVGAGAILHSGIELDSGLLVPAGTEVSGKMSSEESEDASSASVEEAEAEKTFEQRVEVTIQALAQHYAEFGAKPEDFGLVSYEDKEGKKVNTVMLTTAKGLDLGVDNRSYVSIMGNDRAHKVVVGSHEVDTRKGMTKDLYYAFSDSVRRSDLGQIPDEDYGAGNWSVTLLTGEHADHSLVPSGRLGNYRAEMVEVPREDNRRNIRFRPAVEIEA